MRFFTKFKKSTTEPDTSKTSTKAKKTKRKHTGFRRKRKGDYIASMSLGPVAESAFISDLNDFLTDEKQKYIKIDSFNRAIYLLALTNDLIKDSTLADDLGDLYTAIVGSDSRGDAPGTIYNASFESDLNPEAVYYQDETPPEKQVVFLPTMNTLAELARVADAEQKYKVVRLPSDLNENNLDHYVQKREINQAILRDPDSGELRYDTLAEFKQYVTEQTTPNSTMAYDDQPENSQSAQADEQTENTANTNEIDGIDLDTADDNAANDPFAEDEPAAGTDSANPFDDDDGEDPYADNSDDPFADDNDNDETDITDTDDSDDPLLNDDPFADDPAADPDALGDSDPDDDSSENSTTTESNDSQADNTEVENDQDDFSQTENVNDELNLTRPTAKTAADQTATDQTATNKGAIQDDLDALNDVNPEQEDFNLEDDSDDFTEAAPTESDTPTDQIDLTAKAPTVADKPATQAETPQTETPVANNTDSANSSNNVNNTADNNSRTINNSDLPPQTETINHPAAANQDETITIKPEAETATEKAVPTPENTIYLDTNDPEPGLAQIDPNLRKANQLTDENKRVSQKWLKEYSTQIDHWLDHNLKIPVLRTNNRAQYGKQYIAKEVSDNEILKQEVLAAKEQIKSQILTQITPILESFTDPAEYEAHYGDSASELRNLFLNEENMKQESVQRINEIMQKSEQERVDMIKKAQEDAEAKYETEYKPERDREITKAESKVKKEHQEQYQQAVNAALNVIQKNAKPILDQTVTEILNQSQNLVDQAGLKITTDAKTYQKDLRRDQLVHTNLSPDQTVTATTINNAPDANQDAADYDRQMQKIEQSDHIADLKNRLREMQEQNERLTAINQRQNEQINQIETSNIRYRQDALEQRQHAAQLQESDNQHAQDVERLNRELNNIKSHSDMDTIDLDQEANNHREHHPSYQTISDTELFANTKPAEDDEPTANLNNAPKSAPAQAPQL